MVGENGGIISQALAMGKLDTIQTAQCGILHSNKYKRSKKRIDHVISYDNSTCYGQIENFVCNRDNHVIVEISELIECVELPFPRVPLVM